MATLTETAYYTRKTVNWAIVAVIAYLILRFVFTSLYNYIAISLPQKKVEPDNKLGQLQQIVFPEQSATSAATLTYRLGTIDGTIPEASDTARVYFMPKERSSFLGLSSAKALAAQLGFASNPKQLDKTRYEWVDIQNPLRTMVMDTLSKHILLQYRYQSDVSLFTQTTLPAQESIIEEATDFLERNQILPFDINQFRTTIIYLKVIGNKLEKVLSSSDADVARVDFFRNSLDKLPSVTPDQSRGIISLTMSGSKNSKKRILELSYQYWPISYSTFGRYSIIDGQEAFTKLQQGEGFIAHAPKTNGQITIREIFLAYYDSYESQFFYQPVYVFSGDNGFVAYVPAIAPPWEG